ncbi:MAG: helix-turn-helix transcriptional regulator [Lachnospiraceae bacterium]|nr:helix-turn-helix transcriptional regulator [Lachnospiraceae bacterium]
MLTIGEKIKNIRKTNNLTQIEFAKSLGISQTHISKIEKNIEAPSNQLLTFISYKYCVNIDWLNNKSDEQILELGAEREQYINRFNLLRLELENQMRLCATDDIYKIVDSFFYLVKTLDASKEKCTEIDVLSKIYMSIWEIVMGNSSNKTFLYDLIEQLDKTCNNDV